MTRQEAEWLCAEMKKMGNWQARAEPSVPEGYVVAYRRSSDEAYRYARTMSDDIRARCERALAGAARGKTFRP